MSHRPLWHADFLDDGEDGSTPGVRWDLFAFAERVELHRGQAILKLSPIGVATLADLLVASELTIGQSAPIWVNNAWGVSADDAWVFFEAGGESCQMTRDEAANLAAHLLAVLGLAEPLRLLHAIRSAKAGSDAAL